MKTKILCLIPVFNEVLTIDEVYNELSKHNVDIIVIDDGSTDGSKEKIKRYNSAKIFHRHISGKGTCIREGLRYAIKKKYEFLIILDGDMEHNPKYISNFIENIQGYDLVIGQRRVFRSKERIILNVFSSLWLRFLLNDITDVWCGYKLLRVASFRKVQIKSKGFEIELELLLESVKNNLKIKKIPIRTTIAPKSHFNFINYISVINFYNEWIINNISKIRIKNYLKVILIVSCKIGLLLGRFFLKLVKWINFSK